MAGWRTTTLDELDAVPWPGGLTWRPVRAALGVHAFGAGGWTAQRVGEPVVERHREDIDGRGHEELYVVLRGRARFVLDGVTIDVPQGGLVAVTDPHVEREATALEDGTQVLALGREPSFRPAGSEWLMRARPLVATDPRAARAILDEGRAELPASPGVAFGFALLHATGGDLIGAAAELRTALEAEPRLRAEALAEPALAPLLR